MHFQLLWLVTMVMGISGQYLDSGVVYSPWHLDPVDNTTLAEDYEKVLTVFSRIRTYSATFIGINVIDSAAEAGLQVAVGISMDGDDDAIEEEMKAACEGAARNPEAVDAIYVGNEDLENGDFGHISLNKYIGYIKAMKDCLESVEVNVNVGTVQRTVEWLDVEDIYKLVDEVDVIGVNIYSFWTNVKDDPFDIFKSQYDQMHAKFGDKIRVTETGWPSDGEKTEGNEPDKDTERDYFYSYAKWAENISTPESYYFMMFDRSRGYGLPDYEMHFGIATSDGHLKFSLDHLEEMVGNDGGDGDDGAGYPSICLAIILTLTSVAFIQ